MGHVAVRSLTMGHRVWSLEFLFSHGVVRGERTWTGWVGISATCLVLVVALLLLFVSSSFTIWAVSLYRWYLCFTELRNGSLLFSPTISSFVSCGGPLWRCHTMLTIPLLSSWSENPSICLCYFRILANTPIFTCALVQTGHSWILNSPALDHGRRRRIYGPSYVAPE